MWMKIMPAQEEASRRKWENSFYHLNSILGMQGMNSRKLCSCFPSQIKCWNSECWKALPVLTGNFLLNKVDSLHGRRRHFPEVKNVLSHFILNKVYSFWIEKIKLVNIFIFPELDFVRKADVPPWTKKELKEQRITLWITGNDKVA